MVWLTFAVHLRPKCLQITVKMRRRYVLSQNTICEGVSHTDMAGVLPRVAKQEFGKRVTKSSQWSSPTCQRPISCGPFAQNFVDYEFTSILWFHSHRCRRLILILHCTYIRIEECTGGELRKPMMPVHAILCGILVFRCLVLSIRTIPASFSRSMWLSAIGKPLLFVHRTKRCKRCYVRNSGMREGFWSKYVWWVSFALYAYSSV